MMPSAPALFSTGMISRATASSMTVSTATQPLPWSWAERDQATQVEVELALTGPRDNDTVMSPAQMQIRLPPHLPQHERRTPQPRASH